MKRTDRCARRSPAWVLAGASLSGTSMFASRPLGYGDLGADEDPGRQSSRDDSKRVEAFGPPSKGPPTPCAGTAVG